MARLSEWLCYSIFFSILAAASPAKTGEPAHPSEVFPAGESIPSAPQYDSGQIGRIPGSPTIVLGVADAMGNGPYDLFLLGNRLLPFKHFDENGVPFYGEAIKLEGDGIHGTVIPGPDGETLGIFTAGKRVHVCKFDRSTKTFSSFALSEELDLPGEMGIGIGGRVTPEGKFDVYLSVGDGVAYRPQGEYKVEQRIPVPFHHSPLYIPFDGAGFWRGGIPRKTLFHARFDDLKMEKVESLDRVEGHTGAGELLFDSFGAAVAQFRQDAPPVLVTSENLGIFRQYPISEKTGKLMSDTFVNNQSHVGLRHVAISPSAHVIPDPKTGFSSFITGDSSRVWFYQFSGEFSPNGSPILLPPAPVFTQKAPINLAALPALSPGDVDGDGRIDFIVGNDAGELLFLKNIGEAGKPVFENPVAVLVGGAPLDLKAGYRGSIQGPAESVWGYTNPALYDWNRDGRLDVIMNSVLADYQVMLQIDPKDGVPAFAAPMNMYCDGLQLHLAWRSQPGLTDWGLGGRTCMIALDEQNLMRQFWQIDNQNVERGELLRLKDGSPITANADETAGQTGRVCFFPVDWDEDGNLDLLLGTSRGLSIPAGKDLYLPSHYYPLHQASVLFLRNAGTNTEPVFEYARLLEFDKQRISLGIHTCSPAVVDFGTGTADLYVGEEEGSIKYYPRSRVTVAPPLK